MSIMGHCLRIPGSLVFKESVSFRFCKLPAQHLIMAKSLAFIAFFIFYLANNNVSGEDFSFELLEKVIRLEVKIETMFDSITKTQQDIAELTTMVNKRLNLLKKEQEQIEENISVHKADTLDKLLEGARNINTTVDDFESKITHFSEDFVDFKRKVSAVAKDQSVSYIRWGRTTCPNTSTIIYEGVAAGSHYTHSGGASNTICLPRYPQFGKTYPGQQSSFIYSAEYEEAARTRSIFGKSMHNQDVPCVVCEAKGSAVLMIPARQECNDEWQFEYTGYLMTTLHTQRRSDIKCVDSQPEAVGDKGSDANGDLFYFVEAAGAIYDPPYTRGAELTCVVCTKRLRTQNVELLSKV